jgi:membrane protein DedA with SNARE-associated domain
MLWTGLLTGLGYSIGQPAVDVVHKISHYSLYLTIAIVIYIVFRQNRNQRARYTGAE